MNDKIVTVSLLTFSKLSVRVLAVKKISPTFVLFIWISIDIIKHHDSDPYNALPPPDLKVYIYESKSSFLLPNTRNKFKVFLRTNPAIAMSPTQAEVKKKKKCRKRNV